MSIATRVMPTELVHDLREAFRAFQSHAEPQPVKGEDPDDAPQGTAVRAAFIGRTTPRRDRVGNSGLASQSRAERRRAPRPKKLPALCALLRMSREQAAGLAA